MIIARITAAMRIPAGAIGYSTLMWSGWPVWLGNVSVTDCLPDSSWLKSSRFPGFTGANYAPNEIRVLNRIVEVGRVTVKIPCSVGFQPAYLERFRRNSQVNEMAQAGDYATSAKHTATRRLILPAKSPTTVPPRTMPVCP